MYVGIVRGYFEDGGIYQVNLGHVVIAKFSRIVFWSCQLPQCSGHRSILVLIRLSQLVSPASGSRPQ